MNERIVEIHHQDIRLTLEHSHSEGFSYLSFITAVDYENYFLLVWRLVNVNKKEAMIVETRLEKDSPIAPSSVDLWKGADWHEREIYDLFGITFTGHPDLRRMFLPADFDGHPLRKDYENPEVEKRPESYF